jgi:hypothetical protein
MSRRPVRATPDAFSTFGITSMRLRGPIAGIAMLATAACATAPPPKPPAPAAVVACPTCPSPAAIAAETARLRQELHAAVPQDSVVAPDRYAVWIVLSRQAIAAAHVRLIRPELLVVVDRNPHVQRLALVVADPYGPWQMLGGSKVSTGEAGVRGSFITPTGVFVHDGGILDYRALGTFNENHIRGLGLKGARVWDFGWQTTEKGWGPPGETAEIRMLLHATDPDYLESLLGRPASQGCVRIPAAMNRFLDVHGVLDRDYEELARFDPAYASVLLPDRQPTILAGDKLVIVDSLAPLQPGAPQAAPNASATLISRGVGSGCGGTPRA